MHNLDLQNVKKLKHYSSSTQLARTCTMPISTNLKYFGKEQIGTLDVEKVRQICVSGWFTSHGLAKATHAFDFMSSLNIDCWMSREVVDYTSRTHTSLLSKFLRWQKVTLITSKCLLKLSSTSNYSQYYGCTTPKLSMMPWIENLPCNLSTRYSIAATTHIQFVNLIQLKRKWKKSKFMK